jgi:hypothetical protein
MSSSDFQHFFQPQVQYSVRTIAKHTWVLGHYVDFCRKSWEINHDGDISDFVESNVLNLDPSLLAAFIRYCSQRQPKPFKYYTIQDIIVPSLKRMARMHMGNKRLSEEVEDAIQSTLREVKIAQHSLTGMIRQSKKEAMMLPDLERILSSIPFGYKKLEYCASLFLIMFCSGQRGISMEGVQLKDLILVQQRTLKGKFVVVVVIVVVVL